MGKSEAAQNSPWFQNGNVDARIRDGVIAHTLANSDKVPSFRPKTC